MWLSAMHILVVTGEWFPDSKSGFARVVTESSRLLADRNHTVTVLAPRASNTTLETWKTLEVRRVLARRWPVTFTDVIEVARHSAALRTSSFDVVVAHTSSTAVGLRAARLGPPLVLVYHASGLRELRFLRSRLSLGRRRFAAYLRQPPLSLFAKLAAGGAERTLVLSDFTRSVFVSEHPRQAHRVRQVSGGVDIDWFSPGDGVPAARSRLGLSDKAPLLLTVRRLVPRMGLEELLHAVAELRASREMRLALVGGGMLDAKLRRLSADLGLDDCVLFVGSVADEELRDWYRAADLFVLPTLADEGFGMVTAEALASGTPVVGTRVGATPELLTPLDPRLLSEGTHPQALATAIRRGLSLANPEFRLRCRDYACSRLAWGKVIPVWEEALIEVTEQAKGKTSIPDPAC
jgi:glycosyltransferase involved in cell wall biosynthesis